MKPTKKDIQQATNITALVNWEEAMMELQLDKPLATPIGSNMVMYETTNFYILQSYNTLVACVEQSTGDAFNMLRYEWSEWEKMWITSTKHINKFFQRFGAKKIYRYYPVD